MSDARRELRVIVEALPAVERTGAVARPGEASRPRPGVLALCIEAEMRGLRVTLDVGDRILGMEGREFRTLGPILIGVPERESLITTWIAFDRSISDGAKRARVELAELGRRPDG